MWAFALANLVGGARAVGSWLSRRSLIELLFMGLALFALVQHFQLAGERRHAAKSDARIVELTKKLNELSSKRDTQKIVTRENIKTVTKVIHDADGRAKIVEAAPLPGECKTPSEVLQADL